jgi:hypothetical protein
MVQISVWEIFHYVKFYSSRVADHLGEARTAGRDAVSAIVTDQSARYYFFIWCFIQISKHKIF